MAIPFSKHHFFQTDNQKAVLFTVFRCQSCFSVAVLLWRWRKKTYFKRRPLFWSQIFSVSNCCDIQGSHLIGYPWVSLTIDQSECLVCYFFALNHPSSATNYLKTEFISINLNWVIFSCIILRIKQARINVQFHFRKATYCPRTQLQVILMKLCFEVLLNWSIAFKILR